MGRNYQEELDELSATSLASDVSLKCLARAVVASSGHPLVVVASGGAQIAARWLARLHLMTYGQTAAVVTPLDAISLAVPEDACIWLVSQGGKHGDIRAAAAWAIRAAPLRVFGMIGRDDSPLAQEIDEGGGLSCSLGASPNADGFLSTNGLWAMLCALTRVYLYPAAVDAHDTAPTDAILAWAREAADAMQAVRPSDVLVVVSDPWTAIGAEDLQVRATEAALAPIWITDYRNLGHGRHFWFADRAPETFSVFLSSPEYTEIDTWSTQELPSDLRRERVLVPFHGPLAGLAAVAWSMYWASHLGMVRQRDPGRPGVPAFGERLYEGPGVYPPATMRPTPIEKAIARKLGLPSEVLRSSISNSKFEELAVSFRAYETALTRQTLRAVVFDFDGTLVFSHHRWGPIPEAVGVHLRRLVDHGITLGIATGRGDSVQIELQRALEGADTRRVLVGYHNGAAIRPLNDSAADLDGECLDPALAWAAERLSSRLGHLATFSRRRHQCSLRPTGRVSLRDLWSRTRAVLDEEAVTAGLSAWLSSHSIDVCAPGASKLNVVTHLAARLDGGLDAILRVGDRGAWPGNDFELLDHPNGVSVDECSLTPDRCWNLTDVAGAGPLGVAALLARARLSDARGEFRLITDGEA